MPVENQKMPTDQRGCECCRRFSYVAQLVQLCCSDVDSLQHRPFVHLCIYPHSTLEYTVDLETVEVRMTFTLISRSRVCVWGGGTDILVHSIEWGQDFAFHPQNEDILRCEDLYVRTIKVRESSWGMFHVCESPYKDGTTNLCVGGGGHYINMWVTIINNRPAGALKQ